MITFLKLGHKGNLGNQLFQIASTIGLAKQYHQKVTFPDWKYEKYFENKLPREKNEISFIRVKERHFHYHSWNLEDGDFDIDGWLQSEKYFNDYSDTKSLLEFREDLVNRLISTYSFLFSKPTILLSIRRGDFVNHPNFFQLDYNYYFLALLHNFPNWTDYNLVFTSDDIGYCKYHFSIFKNAFFLEGLTAIEQLALCQKFDNFIISNSTFSWWIAWLGENERSKIIRPIKNFRGQFAVENNEIDYFPDSWIPFNHRKYSFPHSYWKLKINGEFYNCIIQGKFYLKKIKKRLKFLLYIFK